jgi:hypothetical protein
MHLAISDMHEHKSNLGIYLFQEFLRKFIGIENVTFEQTILYLITFHLLIILLIFIIYFIYSIFKKIKINTIKKL